MPHPYYLFSIFKLHNITTKHKQSSGEDPAILKEGVPTTRTPQNVHIIKKTPTTENGISKPWNTPFDQQMIMPVSPCCFMKVVKV